MVQVSYPGVYVQELPSGVRTITGVATSIAVFIGMTRRGPMTTPTRLLSFTDYDRTFSSDTSLSEMTDQVRQFFQNGGTQAFVVRVAKGPSAAAIDLKAADGTTTVFSLAASSDGTDGAQLRAKVDYNTANPERTFNLTLYREIIDASGNATVSDTEVFKDVSVDPTDGRFVKTVVQQSSALAVVPTDPAATAAAGFSASALLGAADGTHDARGAFVAAVQAAMGSATSGQFKVRVGDANAQTKTVVVDFTGVFADATGAALATAFDNAIQAAYGASSALTTSSVTGVSPTTTGADSGLANLRIVANNPGDVVISRADTADIAQKLGLGVAQGGIEVGAFGASRPHPSGYVSVLTNTNALDALLAFGLLVKGDLSELDLTGQQPFTVLASKIAWPVPPATGQIIARGTTAKATSGVSLLNIRENLSAIANAINSVQTKWRAQVHGYRLALLPAFGTASSGASHSFNGQNTTGSGRWAALQTVPEIFAAPAASTTTADSFAGGGDGDPPQIEEYQAAFDAIRSNVDLFNIMVLPRTLVDPASQVYRVNVWGPASDFCVERRAFLLMDADATKVNDVLTEDLNLRIGIAKDHAGLYWPHLVIPDGNGFTKNIDPSGSVAGIMARIDATRGVWKAPAGLEADVRGIRGVDVLMSDAENGLLNPQAINAIRSFPNGIVTWGARTMDGFDNSGDDDFKYVPVRRFESFIEESLVRGLKFAVFEPNDEPLWAQIRLAVGAFLNTLFRAGAFAGATPRDAYFVKVDSETTTQNDINLGIVNVLVGFAPLKPAEFIIVSIRQQAGQVQV